MCQYVQIRNWDIDAFDFVLSIKVFYRTIKSIPLSFHYPNKRNINSNAT